MAIQFDILMVLPAVYEPHLPPKDNALSFPKPKQADKTLEPRVVLLSTFPPFHLGRRTLSPVLHSLCTNFKFLPLVRRQTLEAFIRLVLSAHPNHFPTTIFPPRSSPQPPTTMADNRQVLSALPDLPLYWQAGLVDEDRRDLVHPEGWLSGAMINMVLSAATAAFVPHYFAVITDMLTETARAANHPKYTQRLRNYDILLLPLYIRGNHWALATLNRTTKAASLHDSLASTANKQAADAMIRQFLTEFLGEHVPDWDFTTCASPRQTDASSSGIFTLVTAIHILANRTIPAAPYTVKMWRLVLAHLVAPDSVNGAAIWPYTPTADVEAAIVAVATPEFWESGTYTVSDALDRAAHIQDAAGQRLSKIKVAARERRRVVSELKAIEAVINAARAVGKIRPLATILVDGLGPGIAQAMTDGAASVAFLEQQIEMAEERWTMRGMA